VIHPGFRIGLGAENLTKSYRRTTALSDLNVAVSEGTITALVGPNGAGKSTLIKCWLGFERPDHGHVTVLGLNPALEPVAVLRRVAYVAQGTPLYSDLTVNDHLTLAHGLRSDFDDDHARGRIGNLGIALDTLAGRLSGGQQAQVALAIALATHPSALILDEPLASLDPLARREFLDVLVESARQEGQTVVLSSHIVSDVEHACDGLIILRSGRILLASGVIEALERHYVAPRHLREGREIGHLPPLPAGDPLSLYEGPVTLDEPLRRPSLDELVLGYLAKKPESDPTR